MLANPFVVPVSDMNVLYRHPDLGRIAVPKPLLEGVSRPGAPTKPRLTLREIGIVVATQKRPKVVDGMLRGYELLWHSITHNERVDVGAAIEANLLFATAGTTAVGVITAVAVATTGFTTKTKTDLSIGVITASATTNEFTTLGLARAAGTVSTYTAPASLGATFSQLITKTFTASGGATAHGAALFDSTTVAGSHLFVEDIFASDAVLVNADTVAVQWTYSN
jgi:hypothetical protein